MFHQLLLKYFDQIIMYAELTSSYVKKCIFEFLVKYKHYYALGTFLLSIFWAAYMVTIIRHLK